MAVALPDDDYAPGVLPLTSGQAAAIRVDELAKQFGELPVLDGVSFAVRPGEAVALIGSNGAGKSTLLRCMLRLIEPDRGMIELLGEPVHALPPRSLRRARARVGFVFQRHNLVGRLSALTNVVHGSQARRSGPRTWLQALAPADERAAALACLGRVGLAQLAERRADRLSGGQSQRVAIARALMQRPELVLADEPVASLDPTAGEEVMRLFVDLIRDEGLTLVFTTHDLDHAVRYADRVIGLRAGRIELDAPAGRLNPQRLGSFYG